MRKRGSLQSVGESEAVDTHTLTVAVDKHLRHDHAAAAEIVHNATGALDRVASGTPASKLTDLEFASLEAIVHVLGRPAMRYTNGSVEMPPNPLGDNERWRVVIAISRSKINSTSAAVGKITLGDTAQPVLQGIGWRIGSDLVVTNRHVARSLVENPDDPPAVWRINRANHPALSFAANTTFAIAACPYTSDTLDLAVLRLAPCTVLFPRPVQIAFDTGAVPGAEVYVVGHPSRCFPFSGNAAVFGSPDGSKRWSPGYVICLNSDSTFEHDCSTLGGSSGSCVVAMATHRAVGLHMHGNRALHFAALPASRELEILKTGRV
jgi:hypothetical protein